MPRALGGGGGRRVADAFGLPEAGLLPDSALTTSGHGPHRHQCAGNATYRRGGWEGAIDPVDLALAEREESLPVKVKASALKPS